MGQGSDSIDQTHDGSNDEAFRDRLATIMNERYKAAKTASTGSNIRCPACGTSFVKNVFSKLFCTNQRSAGRLNCKDRYWNAVRIPDEGTM